MLDKFSLTKRKPALSIQTCNPVGDRFVGSCSGVGIEIEGVMKCFETGRSTRNKVLAKWVCTAFYQRGIEDRFESHFQ